MMRVTPSSTSSRWTNGKQGRCALAQPWLWVDHTGRRFFNESRGSIFVDVDNAMTSAGGVSYTIFDQEKMDRMINQGAVLPFNAIVLAGVPLKLLPKTWKSVCSAAGPLRPIPSRNSRSRSAYRRRISSTTKKVNSYAAKRRRSGIRLKKEHLDKFNLKKGPYYALKAICAFFLRPGRRDGDAAV